MRTEPDNAVAAEVEMVEIEGNTQPAAAAIPSTRVDVQRKRSRLKFKRKPPPPAPATLDDATLLPLATASIFSRLTFRWLSPLMSTGYKRPLESTDLWKMDPTKQSLNMAARFIVNFERRQKRASEWNIKLATASPSVVKRILWAAKAAMNRMPIDFAEFGSDQDYAARRATLEAEWRGRSGRRHGSIAWALSDTFPEFWHAVPWQIVSTGCTLVTPLLIKEIITFSQEVNDGKDPHIGVGIAFAVALFLINNVFNICSSRYSFIAEHVGNLARATLISATYDRVFQLSARGRATNPNGKITTHITADISRIDHSARFLHMIYGSIITLIATLILICLQIGPSGIIGFIVFVIAMPCQTWITKMGITLRKKSMNWTEQRTKLLQELLPCMGVVKMFTYEIPYLKRLNDMRRKEMVYLRQLLYTRAATEAFAFSLPIIASVFAFVAYTSLNPNFTPAPIFTALIYFNGIRGPLMMLPRALSAAGDSMNALSRLSTVFEAETIEEELDIDPALDVAVRVSHASFEWVAPPPSVEEMKKDAKGEKLKVVKADKGKGKGKAAALAAKTAGPEDGSSEAGPSKAFTIHGLDLEIPRGRLVAIVGPVGSGKSSVLQSLVGEMRCIGGSVEFGGRLGFCQQSAWIQQETIRANILFGQPWDEDRYWRSVEDASLIPDLESFPDGDLTEIGEGGVNLSGGQKQRVNIARALYYNADIVLMDDPLSAVDAHVGRALFNNAILGLRRAGKTVILVTHALHFLPQVDYIYTLVGGQIAEEGTYRDLMHSGGPFTMLMDQFGGTHEQEENEAADEEAVIEEETSPVAAKEGLALSSAKRLAEGVGGMEGRLMTVEDRKKGAVGVKVYGQFFKEGNVLWLIPVAVMAALMMGSQLMSSVWITYWQVDKFHRSAQFYQGIYGMLGTLMTVFTLGMGAAASSISVNASKSFYRKALEQVFHSPMSFFDTTPLGRIFGVLGKDIDALDNQLAEMLRAGIIIIAMFLGSVILIAINFPYFIVACFVIGCGFMYIAYYYRNTTREVKRLDSVLRSMLYAQFGESLTGLATIRAYGEEERFIRENAQGIDLQNRAYLLLASVQIWFQLRLGWLSSLLVFSLALMCTAGGGSISTGQIALCLTYMSTTTQMLASVAIVFAEVESEINAVERLAFYSNGGLIQEAAYEKPEDAELESKWPSQGAISVDKAVMSYRQGLPPVLKGISVDVKSGERVGIVGRTGAGKTSITVALFRLAEMTSGKISIDGVDLAAIGLKALRSKIAIIPQDPILFSGTLRSNLDPFNNCNDERLYDALHRARLRDIAGGNAQRFSLDMVVEDNGGNLSIGERSLVSLARAFVKDSRVMVLDEATAAVDLETDAAIQIAIRAECQRSSKTLLCIAHRLRTIIGWDKILVMDAGEVRDFASPLELFDDVDGIFRSMCERSSITREEIERARQEETVVGGSE